MKKRIIVTPEQLKEYVKRKKTETTVNSIISEMHRNSKNLNEGISLVKSNNMIIEKYKRLGKLTSEVETKLRDYGIIYDGMSINENLTDF